MDSMRSLNTSLPRTGRPQPAAQPNLNQSFRSAALSVTNLYKSALADIDKARSEGYQEALEDLIQFLDKENLGVGDGEGWRVRQWATERWDGGPPAQSNSDSDEDATEEKRARSSSPIMERNQSPEEVRADPPHVEATHRSDSAPPIQADPVETDMTPPQASFSFRAPYSYPAAANSDSTGPDHSMTARRSEFSSRRASNRTQNRNIHRMAAANILSLGSGAGQKRKVPFNDFFNIDSFSDRRDGSGGGGKRGRTF